MYYYFKELLLQSKEDNEDQPSSLETRPRDNQQRHGTGCPVSDSMSQFPGRLQSTTIHYFFTFEFFFKKEASGQEAERNTYIILGPVAERFNEEVSVKSHHIDNFLENFLINLPKQKKEKRNEAKRS